MKTINVKGVIISSDEQWIYDWFEMESTSPKNINDELSKANGDELEVIINSGGGDAFAGSEIYTALKSYSGNVTTKIVGIAASAASVIAMAGDKVVMSPTAQMMIHNVSSRASGDYRDMTHSAEVLKNANDTIANAYRLKSGLSQEKFLALMDAETWMTAQQAKENKLIDEIMFEKSHVLVNSFGSSNMLPKEVIDKMRNSKTNQSQTNEVDFLMQKNKSIQMAKLNLLKLKGEKKNDI